jgi:hypothetical protein
MLDVVTVDVLVVYNGMIPYVVLDELGEFLSTILTI